MRCIAGSRPSRASLNAGLFTPQSRPRVFFVALAKPHCSAVLREAALSGDAPQADWSPPALLAAQGSLSPDLATNWVWWRLPPPSRRNIHLAELLEDSPADAPWRAPAATLRLLALMAPAHRDKIRDIAASGERRIGAVYRRTRVDEDGVKRQRAEARFDGMAGCLRTPGGGSSRQTLLEVQGESIRSRLLSPREAARLMGLPDSYLLPTNATKAYKLCGDGLCVPVIRHLAQHLLQPLLRATPAGALAAAE